MKVWLKRLPIVLIVLAGAIQLVRPAKTNPAIEPSREINAVLTVDPGVAATLGRSCNDCHSNRTAWPWYSNIAPVSWLVARDVEEGRRELNFSEWGTYQPERRDKLLKEMCSEVREGEMPGALYPILHPQAKLTAGDVQALCTWTNTVRSPVQTSGQPGRE